MSNHSTKNISTCLIVDDHPMSVDGYINLITICEDNKPPRFITAFNLKDAFHRINELSAEKVNLDIAFLDINLPGYREEKLNSGADLALIIRTLFPDCKIVIITMHNEPLWIKNIVESINPEGLISKNDVNFRTFPPAYKDITSGKFYYSASILEAKKSLQSTNLSLDQFDTKILLLLAEGKKTVNLPEFIGLSLSAIEKRKAGLKKELIIQSGSDEDLIQAAKNLGLI